MYFVFVNNDVEAARHFEDVLQSIDSKRLLITISNGFELIQFLQNVKIGQAYPDLIILTPKFLRISGTELLELLKTDDFYRLIPVFMLLPEENNDDKNLCNRLGTEYMPIPNNKNEWLNAVHKMCGACS